MWLPEKELGPGLLNLPEVEQLSQKPSFHKFQQRLSDLIGPYQGTYGIAYRVLQPLLVVYSCWSLRCLVGANSGAFDVPVCFFDLSLQVGTEPIWIPVLGGVQQPNKESLVGLLTLEPRAGPQSCELGTEVSTSFWFGSGHTKRYDRTLQTEQSVSPITIPEKVSYLDP